MFVAVKHGVRETGMAALAVNLKDEEIWPIVWFPNASGACPPRSTRCGRRP